MNTLENTTHEMELVNQSTPTPFKVMGWEINHFPPEITKAGGYRSSPTKSHEVDSASTTIFPQAELSPESPTGVWLKNGLQLSPGTLIKQTPGTNPRYKEYWDCSGDTVSINMQVKGPVNSPVTLAIATQAIDLNGNTSANYNIWINGQPFSMGTTPNTDPNLQKLTWAVPEGLLNKETNAIALQAVGTGAAIFRVGMWSEEVPLKASFYWKSIAENEVTAVDPQTFTYQVTSGTTNTDTQINSFSTQLGIEISAGIQDELLSVSEKLSASFTQTNTNEHSVAITQSTEKSWSTQFSCPTDKKSLTFQVWQLHMVYEAGDDTIDQHISMGDAPLFIRIYEEDKTGPM